MTRPKRQPPPTIAAYHVSSIVPGSVSAFSPAGGGHAPHQSSSWRRMVADIPCSHLRCAGHSAGHRQVTNARGGASYEDAIAFATPYADHGLISTWASAALLGTLLHPAEEIRRPSGSWYLPLSIFNQSPGSLTAACRSFDFGQVDFIAALMCYTRTASMANLLVESHRTISDLQRLNQHRDHKHDGARKDVAGDLTHPSAWTVPRPRLHPICQHVRTEYVRSQWARGGSEPKYCTAEHTLLLYDHCTPGNWEP